MKFKVSNVQERTTAEGKEYKTMTITSDTESKDNVSAWPNYSQYTMIKDDAEVDGVLFDSGKYTSLKDEYKPKASGSYNKTAGMEKLIEKKSQNISDAQGRNEVMWAKYNACELVAHHPAFKDLNDKEVEAMVINLASKIKNSDLAPF
jgi:hypothetical protein